MKFQRITEGLVSNRISSIYQDSFEYIWVGTFSGLHRYDGIQFHVYTSGTDSTTISDNYIGEIYEDSQNNLWFGTINGMMKYNRETDDFTRFELPNISQVRTGESALVNTIIEDNDNKLWVGGGGESLYYFDEKIQRFIPYGNLGTVQVNSITAGKDNTLWLATFENGLGRLNTKTGELNYFNHNPADSNSIISSSIGVVEMASDGTLWIGTQGSGLIKMEVNNGEYTFYKYLHQPGNPNSLGNNDIFSLYIDNSENLWVGNENGGLHLYNKEDDSFFRYDSDPEDPYSLTHNSIWNVFQDRQGRYWIGTSHSGINLADPYDSKFTHYFNNPLSRNSLNNDIIRDFWESEDGKIWIATDGGGLNVYDRQNGTFSAYQHNSEDPISLGSNAVIALNQDEDGYLWVGTWAGGLNILLDEENGVFTTFNEWSGFTDYPIRSVFDVQFEDQYIWIAAFEEGLYRYNKNNESLQLFTPKPDDPASLITTSILRIFLDSANNLWVGTQEGLSFMSADDKEEGIFKRFLHSVDDSTSIAGNSIRQIFEDSSQTIWIATDRGLSRYSYQEENFKNFYQSDGLPANDIRSIIEDDNNRLWIGTIQGISNFDPENNTFTNYHRSDGLQSNEFSRYSVHKTQNGELLFGGTSGFNIFNPDNIIKNPTPPPVYLTDLKLFNRSVDIKDPESPLKKHISVTDTLVLSHQHSVITFDFVALNYTRTEHNQYAYMVEGFEEDWNYVGTQRNATYTNLDPGEYIFRVKAANNDGVWNDTGTSLALVITPPFWKTAWFYFLTILFVGGILIAAYRLRVRSIREHNRRLEKQVTDRTDELKLKNRDLISALNELEAAKDELVEKAHKAGMADIATGVLHNVGNILNSVNTSTSLIKGTIKKSKVEGLFKANQLLREHIDHIDRFVAENPKGKELMKYYLKLEEPLKKERNDIVIQSDRLEDKINLINEVIAAQQTYAGASIHASQTSLNDMIDNALALQAGSIERHGLTVKKDLQATSPVIAQRSKLIHVLVNIFKNAKESMDKKNPVEKILSIKTWQDEKNVFLSITDNGTGIEPENLDKIFTQGFTTKKSGHGFGLHSCANYMNEMGGKIEVNSDGAGKGSTFTITIPRIHEAEHEVVSKNLEQTGNLTTGK